MKNYYFLILVVGFGMFVVMASSMKSLNATEELWKGAPLLSPEPTWLAVDEGNTLLYLEGDQALTKEATRNALFDKPFFSWLQVSIFVFLLFLVLFYFYRGKEYLRIYYLAYKENTHKRKIVRKLEEATASLTMPNDADIDWNDISQRIKDFLHTFYGIKTKSVTDEELVALLRESTAIAPSLLLELDNLFKYIEHKKFSNEMPSKDKPLLDRAQAQGTIRTLMGINI